MQPSAFCESGIRIQLVYCLYQFLILKPDRCKQPVGLIAYNQSAKAFRKSRRRSVERNKAKVQANSLKRMRRTKGFLCIAFLKSLLKRGKTGGPVKT